MHRVHLYLFDQLAALPENFVAEHLHLLPAFRSEQCAHYRQTVDQQNCIIAYRLLLQGLRELYGITDQVVFAYGKHGKPYLKEYPHIFFNISHCRHGAVCAFGDFEIGVDMQDVRPYDPAVARRVCSEGELRLLSEADNPVRMFCKIWTARESYAKMLGCSVADILRQDLVLEDIAYLMDDHYYLALCRKNHAIEIIVHKQLCVS